MSVNGCLPVPELAYRLLGHTKDHVLPRHRYALTSKSPTKAHAMPWYTFRKAKVTKDILGVSKVLQSSFLISSGRGIEILCPKLFSILVLFHSPYATWKLNCCWLPWDRRKALLYTCLLSHSGQFHFLSLYGSDLETPMWGRS